MPGNSIPEVCTAMINRYRFVDFVQLLRSLHSGCHIRASSIAGCQLCSSRYYPATISFCSVQFFFARFPPERSTERKIDKVDRWWLLGEFWPHAVELVKGGHQRHRTLFTIIYYVQRSVILRACTPWPTDCFTDETRHGVWRHMNPTIWVEAIFKKPWCRSVRILAPTCQLWKKSIDKIDQYWLFDFKFSCLLWNKSNCCWNCIRIDGIGVIHLWWLLILRGRTYGLQIMSAFSQRLKCVEGTSSQLNRWGSV